MGGLSVAVLLVIGGVLAYAAVFVGMSFAAGKSKSKRIRDQWAPVLDVETKLWSAKSCEQLIRDLTDVQAYEVAHESKQYQVEVELLENTPKYVHVMVSVDDGSLPASIRPLSTTFLRYKDGSDSANT